MPAPVDIAGRVPGTRLTAIRPAGHDSAGKTMWMVQCDCGSPPKRVQTNALRSGNTVSCGCHHAEVAAANLAAPRPAECRHCCTPFAAANRRQKYCSAECARRHYEAAGRVRRPAKPRPASPRERPCLVCGRPFAPTGRGKANATHCSPECVGVTRAIRAVVRRNGTTAEQVTKLGEELERRATNERPGSTHPCG